MSQSNAIAACIACIVLFAFHPAVARGDAAAAKPAAQPSTMAPAPGSTAGPAPDALVDAQLEAYNRRDLEAFLAFYADDAVLVDYPDQVTQAGKAAMRERYQKRFANPNVRATIARRIVFGRFVIDHEQITAPPAAGMIEAVAIYEIVDGKIVRVTFLKP